MTDYFATEDLLAQAEEDRVYAGLIEPKTVYHVINRHTGAIVGTYSTAQRARNRRDKLDLQYGAIRYTVRSDNAHITRLADVL